jgi:hypothetical protein
VATISTTADRYGFEHRKVERHLRPPRVLLVDDDASIRVLPALLTGVLERTTAA